MKRFLSILLAILMLAVMLPVTAMADEGATGDGSQSNPYTLEQLGAMKRDDYIKAQERLGGTMYVTVGNYDYSAGCLKKQDKFWKMLKKIAQKTTS